MVENEKLAPGDTPPSEEDWEVERKRLRAELGARMKAVRQSGGLTLDAAAQATGLALSTIHKIENGRASPSYENLVRIARGYGVSLEQLYAADHDSRQTTRMTVTRAGEGAPVRVTGYRSEVLCNALTDKKIIPLVARIDRRAPYAPEELQSHAGEETLYVLSGRIELVVEHYKPVVLEPGDCAYFDSTLAHGLRALDDTEAVVFWAGTQFDVD
ncbi:helix-turn-helix domain-containing protein [Pseudoponticoccus marisrubri]|uniref:XRE family transcriptional regulator n=1 Tax=Pseudoponticoccus marisrubri TaxID=1685382 RepID=A0A0W7WHJ9_9RHOB|nr:XRE family transcriptional regulator [Pseudoponticoccus marisrubri]KUF10065.1 XRE family transcriptional regulator [Pseudoponticoccus marisrubri]